ncbi:MAG: 3-hydroxybutyryl-CoA dehydratase [Chloroflexi bacterium]|jgi:3-hydroxybutyryl-CoA dehydratase|nr:MAG: 3-hydroxybutyryl-CoA dehydratase [Chloroflexota bacterium]
MNIPTAFEVGAAASITKTITLEDVESFAKISGDDQPVHISPDYASNTRFGGQIAHGTILIGLISAILGNVMAGNDYTVIFLGQSCKWISPVKLNDTITAECVVTKVRSDKPIVNLDCICTNQDQIKVMEGTATVYIDAYPYKG